MKWSMLLSFLFLFSCAHQDEKKSDQTTSITPIEGTRYTTVIFPSGISDLDPRNKKNLQEFTRKFRQHKKKISEIKILAWADAEYPNDKKNKGTTREVILAAERAQNIKEYLQDELHEKNEVDTFNMAKRPSQFSQMLENEEYKIKKSYEKSGVTGSVLSDGSISYTKASKALVIINYEGDDLKL